MLTDCERHVYDFARAYTRRHGAPPELREDSRILAASRGAGIELGLTAT